MQLLPKVGVHTCDAILQVVCHLDKLRKQGLAINIPWFQRQCMQTLLETSLELSARHGITRYNQIKILVHNSHESMMDYFTPGGAGANGNDELNALLRDLQVVDPVI